MSAAALEALPVLAQSHVIKITALMTAIACGTYVFWHTFIKDRPNYNGNGQRPQQQVCQFKAEVLRNTHRQNLIRNTLIY